MNFSRRRFVVSAGIATGVAVLAKQKQILPGLVTANSDNNYAGELIVYHTNHIEGHIRPVYRTMGGLEQLNAHLKTVKNSCLLLDAGHFMDWNDSFDHQQATVAAMNRAGYAAAGIGGFNLSDDGGQLRRLALQFPLINCNHRLSPALKQIIKPYLVVRNGTLKVGVTAVSRTAKGAVYKDAIACANRTARFLKENAGCDLVICLSDLGHPKSDAGLNDHMLAESSAHIDLIIGNDHGKMLNNDMILGNKLKNEIIFSAAISRGLTAGKTIITFSGAKTRKGTTVEHIIPGKPAGQGLGAAMREFELA